MNFPHRVLSQAALCFAIGLLACPTASAAWAHWNTTDSLTVWHDGDNWLGGTVPAPGDHARIGSLAGIQNAGVRIDQPVFIDQLDVLDGMALLNLSVDGVAHPITVAGVAQAHGVNLDEPALNPSVLRLFRGVSPYDLSAEFLVLNSGADLDLRGGAVIDIDEYAFVSSGSTIEGRGVINLGAAGDQVTLRNEGAISSTGASGLTLNQLGDGRFDLDGASDNGVLGVSRGSFTTGAGPARMTINGSGLTDSFSGQIKMATGRSLTMNLSEGWIADSQSEIWFSASSAEGGPARLSGDHLTLEGRLRVFQSPFDAVAWADIESDVTINESASIEMQEGALSFDSKTVVNGGTFTLDEKAHLAFHGETAIRGGDFSTPSMDPLEASVTFNGETEWEGNVHFAVSARQSGDATVTAISVIHADLFDMDGPVWNADRPSWQINSSLVVNADTINAEEGNLFRGSMHVAGGFLGKATINLSDPAAHWTMAGVLSLDNNVPFGTVRLAGSAVRLEGVLNVEGAAAGVSADAVFAALSETSFSAPEASLVMSGRTRVEDGALFFGEGTVGNSASGQMTLDDGVSTDEVGLANQGLLDIDDEIGIATVDRFQNLAEGVLAIDLAGHVLGDSFDHLMVAGAAEIDGTLSVDLMTDEGGTPLFTPALGDEFMIMTSLGGVSGEFSTVLSTEAGGNVYGWEVLYHPHDITIRLANIIPEPAGLVSVVGAIAIGLMQRKEPITRAHE